MKVFNFLKKIGVHFPMQDWTATTRHGVTRKRNTKRLRHIGNLFRKNLHFCENRISLSLSSITIGKGCSLELIWSPFFWQAWPLFFSKKGTKRIMHIYQLVFISILGIQFRIELTSVNNTTSSLLCCCQQRDVSQNYQSLCVSAKQIKLTTN